MAQMAEVVFEPVSGKQVCHVPSGSEGAASACSGATSRRGHPSIIRYRRICADLFMRTPQHWWMSDHARKLGRRVSAARLYQCGSRRG